MKKFTFKGVLDGFRSSVSQPSKSEPEWIETLKAEHLQLARVSALTSFFLFLFFIYIWFCCCFLFCRNWPDHFLWLRHGENVYFCRPTWILIIDREMQPWFLINGGRVNPSAVMAGVLSAFCQRFCHWIFPFLRIYTHPTTIKEKRDEIAPRFEFVLW